MRWRAARSSGFGLAALLALALGLSAAAGAAAAGPGGWDHLGDGGAPGTVPLDSTVSELYTAGPGALYVGGDFASAGGNPAAARLALWDGFAWHAVGAPALTGIVQAVTVHAGKIYAGGTFTNAGGDAGADFLAVWDGVSWKPFCNPAPAISGAVNALQVIGSTLYVGGDFLNGAGIPAADYLLACDLDTGAATATVAGDGGFTGGVNALTRDNAGTLYAAGGFLNLDQITAADGVASYDGTWHALGVGPGPGGGALAATARSIASNGTDVFVGTDAVNVAGIPQADHVAKWNGVSGWSALGANTAGNDGWIPAAAALNDIAVADGAVVVTGLFQNADGNAVADNVARFENGAWSAMGSDGAGNGAWSGNGLALAVFGGDVIAGGTFTSAGGDPQARFVARYPQSVATPSPTPTPTSTATATPIPIEATPRAPTVTITSPAANTFFNYPEQIVVSGKVTAAAGLAYFCVTANTPAVPPAAGCSQAPELAPDGSFDNLHVYANTRPGANTITAYAVDLAGREQHASVEIDLPNGLDLRATSMEVNQSVQRFGLPLNLGVPVAYSGVKLVQGATTVVRVYANAFATGRAPGRPIPDVPALLTGTRNGASLPGSPLSPDSGPASLPAGPLLVSFQEIADPNSGYTFTLPLSWTSGSAIQLRSVVNPQTNASAVPEAGMANNSFTLTNVGFEHHNPLVVSPLKITYHTPENPTPKIPGDPAAAFAGVRNVMPLGDGQLNVLPYRGTIDVSDLFARPGGASSFGILERVAAWEAGHNELGLTMGIIVADCCDVARGMETPWPFAGATGPRVEAIAYARENGPLGSVGHELFHALNYFHAGHRCASGKTTDFPFVHWGPDDQGFIQGMGLDRTAGSGGRTGTYRRLIPGAGISPALVGQKPDYYDLMSYCPAGFESYIWISTRSWDGFGGVFPIGLPEPAINHRRSAVVDRPDYREVGGASLQVAATVNADGTGHITSVRPGDSGRAPVSDEDSPFRIVVRDAAGTVISSTGVKSEQSHVDYDPGNIGAAVVAEVPAAGAQIVELTYADAVLATRTRSAHPPTVKLLGPAAGSTIRPTGNTTVRWKAADADGDPLEVTLSYSADGGHSFRNLAIGGFAGKTTVPATLFDTANNGRIRIEVNDGFDEASAVSGRLRVAGAAPVVRILKPIARQTVRADVALPLLGEAFDAAGKSIKTSRLTWFDGRRRIGRGLGPALIGLAPGRHRLTLQARGPGGQTGRETVTVSVSGVKPDLMITAPKSISRKARKVKLRVASTVPGVLRAGGRSLKVTRRPRPVSVRVEPGKKPLSVRLVIRAGGRRVAYTVSVPRR